MIWVSKLSSGYPNCPVSVHILHFARYLSKLFILELYKNYQSSTIIQQITNVSHFYALKLWINKILCLTGFPTFLEKELHSGNINAVSFLLRLLLSLPPFLKYKKNARNPSILDLLLLTQFTYTKFVLHWPGITNGIPLTRWQFAVELYINQKISINWCERLRKLFQWEFLSYAILTSGILTS